MTFGTDAFNFELVRRLPLARAVMEAFNFAFEPPALERLYEANRGRCYTDQLTFPTIVNLVRDSLLEHGGSGHRMYAQLERAGDAPADESSFYRKLANMPVEVSRALLRDCTARLTQLIPAPAAATATATATATAATAATAAAAAAALPACVAAFELVVLDGKKVKHVARRLVPTRGYRGALLGAKALAAMSLRSGMAIAISDSLDGEANEVPLVGALVPQVLAATPGPVLFLADRQFGDYKTHKLMRQRPTDHVLLRLREGLPAFEPEAGLTRAGTDEQGRRFIDEVGRFGTGKHVERMRRITLYRTGADGKPDNIVLLTDLLDPLAYPAADLLKLYRRRWGIEQMFQEVTETFSLKSLISCSPKGVLFQLSLCLLLYNLVQVVKAYVAADGAADRAAVSTANLFYDVKRELSACSYLAPGALLAAAGVPPREAPAMCRRLADLLAGSWDAVAYAKAVDKNPRKSARTKGSLHGGHTSVQRLLDGKVKVRMSKQ